MSTDLVVDTVDAATDGEPYVDGGAVVSQGQAECWLKAGFWKEQLIILSIIRPLNFSFSFASAAR